MPLLCGDLINIILTFAMSARAAGFVDVDVDVVAGVGVVALLRLRHPRNSAAASW